MIRIRPWSKLCAKACVIPVFGVLLALQGCTAYTNSPSSGSNPSSNTPTAPSGLTATATSSTQVTLTWTASTGNITGYQIERCSGANCSAFTLIATTAATSYADTGLSASTSYSYRVRAMDGAGGVSGYSNTTSATTPAAAAISVSVSPNSSSVNVSMTQQFNATVQNDTQNLGVTWSVNGVAGGNTTVGTITTSGLYTAPASVPGSGVMVTATSKADSTRSGSATVTVLAAVSVSVSPSAISVQVAQSQNFTATVANDPGSQGVNWTLSGSGCSGSTCGTLSNVTTTSVTYTAPASVPSPATVTLTATSKRDATKSNAATITVTAAPVISVSVSPNSVSVATSGAQNFTATLMNDTQNKGVSWSLSGAGCSGAACGTLSNITATTVTYTAPATVPNPATVTLTATSIADRTKTGTATITVTPGSTNITVNVTPKRGGLVTSQKLSFTATLTNDTGNQGVIWSSTAGAFSACSAPCTTVTFTASPAAGVVTVTATAVADSTKTATATIGVTDLTGVTTYLNGNTRQGGNLQEYALATSGATAVNTANFGKLFSCTVDAAVYAQPLWVANLTVNGGTHNVVFAATQHDMVYAFDADANGSPCVPLWRASLFDTSHGGASGDTWVTSSDVSCLDLAPDIGVVGTPVIDLSTNTVYVVSKTKNASSTTFYQRIHALDITTGNEKFSGPVAVSATVAGTGDGSSGGSLSFDPLKQNQRPALLLVNGHIIISWASHCDNGPYHGWVMSYHVSSSVLTQEAVVNLTPNGINGGIWMSGGGPAADSSGNIYMALGNGTFDANTGGSDYGDTILKLGPPSGGVFPVMSYFRSLTLVSPDTADTDQGSGDASLLPTVGGHNYLTQAGKDGNIYVLDQASLGGLGGGSNAVQFLPGELTAGMWSSPTYWNGYVYFGPAQDGGAGAPMRAFSFDTVVTGLLSTTPTSLTTHTFNFPGPTAPISSSGTTNGIVWALDNSHWSASCASASSCQYLYAYDASNLNLLYTNSGTNTGSGAVKFTVPMVANGKVYVGGQNTLTVYGLLP